MNRSNGPRKLQDLPSSSLFLKNYKFKKYLHFDFRLLKDNNQKLECMMNEIRDPKWVSSYAFFPYIHFEIVFKKYVTIKTVEDGKIQKTKESRKKVRKIYYAAHRDSIIYKYYGDLLNDAYNKFVIANNLDDVAIAYRNNKPGKNNIHFAHEVFDTLMKQDQAIVIALDFTSFFDKISHKALKRNLKKVLNVSELSDDWYAIYKNLTRYSYIDKEDIDNFLLDKYGRKKLENIRHKLPRLMNSYEFRAFKQNKIKINDQKYGIPQGSAISAVCSNVHLIEFDSRVLEWVKSKNPDALYRRYCDDLVLVIPTEEVSSSLLKNLNQELIDIVESFSNEGLVIQPEKTELKLFKATRIYDIDEKLSSFDYLGFVTDGHTIKIREKSLFKYYSRAYKKAKDSKRISLATRKPGPKRELYDIYTHLGFEHLGYGNFITYANKAHHIMSTLPCKSLISRQVARHWNKIHKKL